jgi:AcrR family transcriptional regulator
MARSKSNDKRRAILEAAIEVFAERGLAHGPTSAISKAAGIAEGTLFTYFASKDDLINELYRNIRKEFDRELVDYPFKADARARLRFIWDRFLNLSKTQPKRLRVIKQLRASGQLLKEEETPSLALSELLRTTSEAFDGSAPNFAAAEFLVLQFRAQADATADYIAAHPGEESEAWELGFHLLWRGLTGR